MLISYITNALGKNDNKKSIKIEINFFVFEFINKKVNVDTQVAASLSILHLTAYCYNQNTIY